MNGLAYRSRPPSCSVFRTDDFLDGGAGDDVFVFRAGGGTAAQEIVGNTGFGTQAQALKPLSELQAGALRLG